MVEQFLPPSYAGDTQAQKVYAMEISRVTSYPPKFHVLASASVLNDLSHARVNTEVLQGRNASATGGINSYRPTDSAIEVDFISYPYVVFPPSPLLLLSPLLIIIIIVVVVKVNSITEDRSSVKRSLTSVQSFQIIRETVKLFSYQCRWRRM